MCATQAQRDAQVDVGTFTTPQAEVLANAVNSWLDLHPDLPTTHGSQFVAIHSLPNFFPWHRAHIRELEEHLGSLPADPTLLPRWRPRASAGEPSNAMPEPFRLTNHTPQLLGMPNPDPLVAIPSTIDLPGASCLGVDEFSSLVQGDYHDLVHSAVGGLFLDQGTSATVIGFWPWHAWVDEFWYEWEKNCNIGYTKFPAPGATEIIVNSTETWSGEHFVKGKVIIENGGRLNIAPGAVVHFRSSDYESYETSIVVKPGGSLYVDGAKLTGIDKFGTNFGGAGGIQYHSGWKGILVEGTGAFGGNHGLVSVLNGSTIEHASRGIESKGGGRVVAINSTLSDNRECLYIHDFNFINHYQFYISRCTFDFKAPLRDVTWTPDGNLPRYHFLHNIPESPALYVRLQNVKSALITNCVFNKSHVIGGEPTAGIVGTNARFSCTNGTTFAPSLNLGIAVYNTVSGPYGDPVINGNVFHSREGILLVGADYVTISGNMFNNPVSSIEASGSSAYDIFDNVITGGAGAMSLLSEASTGNHANVIERNNFTGGKTQLQFQFGNPDVQFRCNQFNSPVEYAAALTSGNLPDQGKCVMGTPAGNTWNGCVGPVSQLFRSTIAGTYTYSAHSDRVPTCVSQGITVKNCDYDYFFNPSCEVDPPCTFPCPDFPEEGDIAARESQKQTWAASGLPPEEVAAIIWQLTWEQKIIAQRGLLRVIEADSTLATAFDYLDQVGAVFPFPASDRISLHLSSGNLAAANSLIAALPAGNEKTLFNLLSALKAEGRSFEQITPAEEQTVRTMAAGSDQAAAQAKSILYAAFGEEITVEPESPSGERETPNQFETEFQSGKAAALIFLPNPSQGVTTVRYTLNAPGQQGVFVLYDIYGRQIKAQRFTADVITGEIRVDTSDLPSGTYIGSTIVDGHRQASSKLTVVK